MFRKAQAAMEFLMTYGWALLAVLVVIGALAYLGVLDVEILLPERCTFPVPLNCEDHVVNEENIQVVLLNGAGRGMAVRSIVAESEAFDADGSGDDNYKCIWTPIDDNSTSVTTDDRIDAAGSQLLKNGESETFTLNIRAPHDLAFKLDSSNMGEYKSSEFGDANAQQYGATADATTTPPTVAESDLIPNLVSNNDDGVITFLSSTVLTENCGYNDVGRGKNKYSVTVYYTWSDSRNILHKVSGEMFTAAPG